MDVTQANGMQTHETEPHHNAATFMSMRPGLRL